MKRRFIATFLTAAVGIGVTTSVMANDQNPPDASYPVVTQLVLRDRTITITADPNGHRYAIADAEGTTLQTGLSEDQFSKQYPDLYDLLRPAVAEDGEGAILLMQAPNID